MDPDTGLLDAGRIRDEDELVALRRRWTTRARSPKTVP
jgi:hypothetical protein